MTLGTYTPVYNNTASGKIYTLQQAAGNKLQLVVSESSGCPSNFYDHEGNLVTVTALAGMCWTNNMRNKTYPNDDAIPFARAYQDENAKADLYGLLYDWESATGVAVGQSLESPQQGICPLGWHIPSRTELASLGTFSADELKSLNWIGTDISGFSALPAGKYYSANDKFMYLLSFAGFWSSETATTEKSYCSCLNNHCEIIREISAKKTDGFSVRCVMD
jgi:uncharacterized protein (TIGR02145 family)